MRRILIFKRFLQWRRIEFLWLYLHHIEMRNWNALSNLQIKALLKLLNIFLLPVGFFLVLAMRLIRPWLLVRIDIMLSERIGHFAANTEMYLCEHDAGINVPNGRYVDLWYFNWPISNHQLACMIKRELNVWPRLLLGPIAQINKLIPGGEVHQIGMNIMHDRDVLNLMDGTPTHLKFLPEEEKRGKHELRALGIPEGGKFVCLIVRDSRYLKEAIPWRKWDYHDHRDCDIKNYIVAAETLVERGYYVIRMGVAVQKSMGVNNPMIIDYAAKGLRTDFMDIYLGAKCSFCISSTTGFDAIPYIFRRPIVFVDMLPLIHICTFSSKFLSITKKLWLRSEQRFLTFRELFSPIFESSQAEIFERMGIDLIESTPEEISAVVLEMEERVSGNWVTSEKDELLQRRFWALLSESPLHGEIRSNFGADFLQQHEKWLDDEVSVNSDV